MNENENNIFRDTAVHDYVAGHMSDESREHFESILADNKTLQKEVESERELRSFLTTYEQNNSDETLVIADDNLDKLFASIDLQDQQNQQNINRPKSKSTDHWFNRNLLTFGSIAASVVFATLLFIAPITHDHNNDFALLSDKMSDNGDSLNVNFNALVEANKVVQIWLANDLPEAELSALFLEHGLKPIGRAGEAWIVASAQAIQGSRIEELRADNKFTKVTLVTYNKNTQETD